MNNSNYTAGNGGNMTNEQLLALFDHYGVDSRDALIEHLIEADRQARERYEHMVRTTTPEERKRILLMSSNA